MFLFFASQNFTKHCIKLQHCQSTQQKAVVLMNVLTLQVSTHSCVTIVSKLVLQVEILYMVLITGCFPLGGFFVKHTYYILHLKYPTKCHKIKEILQILLFYSVAESHSLCDAVVAHQQETRFPCLFYSPAPRGKIMSMSYYQFIVLSFPFGIYRVLVKK